MPGKKKSKKSNTEAAQRPIPIHQDSLRRDIEAARSAHQGSPPNGDGVGTDGSDEDGLDIADQLLASLDARDKAAERLQKASMDEEEANRQKGHFLHHHHHEHRHASTSSSPTNGLGSSTSPLRNAGELLLHAGEKLFGGHHEAPPDGKARTVIPTDNLDKELATDMQRKGSIRKLFSSSPSKPVQSSESAADANGGSEGGKRKVSRQKARLERKAAEMEAMRIQAQEELKANGGKPDEAQRERLAMQELCQALNVEMKEITPDGHCLYAAVADQLNTLNKAPSGKSMAYTDTRKATADYMRSHPNDFMPFISDSDEHMAGIDNKEAGQQSQMQSAISLQQKYFFGYCDAVEKTGVWGGQPEILALSRAYHTPIHVVQAGCPVMKVGAEEQSANSNTDPVMISYHRHMYGLGEHYNSLHKKAVKISR